MHRSDRPLYAAADPSTVKTEPPGPTPEGGPEPGPAASEAAQTGARPEMETEPVDVTPATVSGHEQAATSDLEPAQPGSPSREAEAAADANLEPEPPEPLPKSVSGETEAAASVDPEPAVAPAQIANDEVAPAAAAGTSAAGSHAPFLADPVPIPTPIQRQVSAPAHGHPRPLLADWDRARVKSLAVRAGKVAAIVFSAWFTVVLVLIAVYRFVNPPFSTLMALKWLGGTSIHQKWEPIDKISPNLVRAVIASEDGRFCYHWGIDFAEMAEAIKRTSHGVPRGASTITMQVAKNLFLLPVKSYLRKIVEVPLTYAIELMWSKQRIMEVYLNIAEWGPGVFGAEAGAQEHFDRSASRLSTRQAALLAVALPNPLRRDAGDPGPWARQRATVIQRRAARSPEEARCVLGRD
jgi:monofunctional glycosyltransferase